MKTNSKYLGKTIIARFGVNRAAVKVIEPVNNSRTMLLVEEVDRGLGWNKLKNKYTGVVKPNGWIRGQNYEFGKRKEIYINQIVADE